MMVIDFHTHSFPDHIAGKAIRKLSNASHSVPFTDGTESGLRRSMEEAGIDFSVVLPVATSPDQVAHINDRAFAMNEHTDGSGLISFGSMHPDCPYWKEELTRLKDHGVKGIKLHPVYQGKDLDDPSYLRILDCCAMLGLVVVTHSGYDIGFPGVSHSSPQMALNAVKAIGRGTGNYCLMLAHMGGWKNWDDTEALAMEMVESGSVMIDTSFSIGSFMPLDDGYWKEEETRMLDRDAALRILHAFGMERVVFGTDSPWSEQKEALRIVKSLIEDPGDLEQVLSKNAERLLDLCL